MKTGAKIGCTVHGAIAGIRGNIVDYMLEHEAPVNVRDEEGRTPIHSAAAIGNQKIVGSLRRRKTCLISGVVPSWEAGSNFRRRYGLRDLSPLDVAAR